MTREDEMTLLEFCSCQHERFDLKAWRGLPGVERNTMAATALFLALSGGAWFGHKRGLERVAEELAPGRDFVDLARAARFDYARFGSMLKMRLRHACPLS